MISPHDPADGETFGIPVPGTRTSTARRGSEVVAIVPDPVHVVDHETAEPITTRGTSLWAAGARARHLNARHDAHRRRSMRSGRWPSGCPNPSPWSKALGGRSNSSGLGHGENPPAGAAARARAGFPLLGPGGGGTTTARIDAAGCRDPADHPVRARRPRPVDAVLRAGLRRFDDAPRRAPDRRSAVCQARCGGGTLARWRSCRPCARSRAAGSTASPR